MAGGRVLGDAVEEVLYGPFHISEGCSEGCNALLTGEAHGEHIVDLGLGGLGGGWSLALLVGWGLDLALLFGLLGLWLAFFFNFGLGGRFLDGRCSTDTWFMTTRKSVYFIPSFSSCSSSLRVLPL